MSVFLIVEKPGSAIQAGIVCKPDNAIHYAGIFFASLRLCTFFFSVILPRVNIFLPTPLPRPHHFSNSPSLAKNNNERLLRTLALIVSAHPSHATSCMERAR